MVAFEASPMVCPSTFMERLEACVAERVKVMVVGALITRFSVSYEKLMAKPSSAMSRK